MKLRKSVILSILVAIAFSPISAHAADKLVVTVTHELSIARPSEMISVPWSEVSNAIPRALIHKIAVKDAAGRTLPFQVTNVAPLAKDPQGKGIAYGDLLFQHDFAAGETRATFTVERIETIAPVFPTRVFARYVPERLDDFAWENDKIAHRVYGPALSEPRPAGSNRELLVSSGVDVWCKRVSYPIVDRWYNKGHDHYHVDQGEGMDMYQVGGTRGCGGTGIWDGQKLHVGRNYKSWTVLANGPIRAIFELTYEPWEANGVKVTETKRFTVDAGHNLNRIESTFTVVEGEAAEITVAIGLNKNCADRRQDPKTEVTKNTDHGSLAQWVVQKTNDSLGTAVLLPSAAYQGFAEDPANLLVVAKTKSAQPIRYYVGAAWSRAGEFTSKEAWNAYIATVAARARSPINVAVSVQ